MKRERIEQVIKKIKDADRYDESISEPQSTSALTAVQDALPLLEEMLAEADQAATLVGQLSETGITRLTVNVGPRTAEAINWMMGTYDVSLTEALRSIVANGYVVTRKAVDEGVGIVFHGNGKAQDLIISMPDEKGANGD